ncbi:MAG: HNH endonuclease [Pseudomonadota bacterium]|nr:HNH endonuclease [Pseudomonadota bacterium]
MKGSTWDEAILAEHRAYLGGDSAIAAFDAMVATAIELMGYEAAPGWHGETRDFSYDDMASGERPFAFIVNRNDLLFYVRSAGLTCVPGGFGGLAAQFGSANQNSREEWTVRIASKEDAERLNVFLFANQSTLQDQVEEARASISALLPDAPVRRAVLEQLIVSAESAERTAPSAWGATLFNDGFRLNVGQVEVFVLSGDSIRLNLVGKLGGPLFIGPSFVEGHYRSMRVNHCAFVGTPVEFAAKRSILERAHLDFVRQAARNKSGEPIAGSRHRDSHSEDLVAYAYAEVGGVVPDDRDGGIPDGITGDDVLGAIGRLDSGASDDCAEQVLCERTDIGATEKQTLVNARRGQGLFRERVIELECRCRVTGVDSINHLRASHIKPWKDSSDFEKLDGNNGLLLAPHVDHLFDQGYIGFADIGDLLVSVRCPAELLEMWGINEAANVGPFRLAQRAYLAHHRAHVLKK